MNFKPQYPLNQPPWHTATEPDYVLSAKSPTEEELRVGLVSANKNVWWYINLFDKREPLPIFNLPLEYQIAARIDPRTWTYGSQSQVQYSFTHYGLRYVEKYHREHHQFGVQTYSRRMDSLELANTIIQMVRDS